MKLNYFEKFNKILTLAMFFGIVFSGCGQDKMSSYPSLDNDFGNVNKSQVSAKPQAEEVTISIIEKGRKNPFRSYQEKNLVLGNDPVLGKIPTPPRLNPNPDINSLLSVKISGILYDNKKPSALINVNNEEHLVHKDDTLFDFKIHNITPDKVVISKGKNVYKAGIGEIIDSDTTLENSESLPDTLPEPGMIQNEAYLSIISESVDNNEETIVIK